MLIDEIRKANIAALKARDKDYRAIYSVLINRYDLLAKDKKDIGDNDLYVLVSKVMKELDEEKEGYIKTNNLNGAASVDRQKEALKPYLPKMLSEEEIIVEINKLEDKSMKNVMTHFKTHFNGLVDMGKVNQILRNMN